MPKQFTPKEVIDTMRKISLMNLAVSDKNNQPQVHMMLFTVDNDFTIYFITSKNSAKYTALLDNAKVAISVWSNKKMLVQIQAEATELTGKEAEISTDKLADAAANIPDFWSPLLQIMKTEYAVFKAAPKSVRALDLSNQAISHKDTIFTNIGAQL